jgi:hypothetical protein
MNSTHKEPLHQLLKSRTHEPHKTAYAIPYIYNLLKNKVE